MSHRPHSRAISAAAAPRPAARARNRRAPPQHQNAENVTGKMVAGARGRKSTCLLGLRRLHAAPLVPADVRNGRSGAPPAQRGAPVRLS